MAKSAALIKLHKRATNRDAFSDMSEKVDELRANAASSRKSLYQCFADAFIWYREAVNVKDHDGNSVLEKIFVSHNPQITGREGYQPISKIGETRI